jgi:beta-phosphoglucomutase-like phosphatase (HAD superfamily)
MMSDFRMHAMDPDDEEQEEEVVNTVPAEEHFRRLLNTSKERVLTILESTVQDQIYDHGEFSEHLEDLLDATRRTERLVKAGLLSEEEVQEAHMVLALAQLLPGMTYQSVIASLSRRENDCERFLDGARGGRRVQLSTFFKLQH